MSLAKGNKFSAEELKIRRGTFYRRVESSEFPKFDNKHAGKDEDGKLYERIKEIYKSPNLKYYLAEVDLGNDFDSLIFMPLNELIFLNDAPDYEFADY